MRPIRHLLSIISSALPLIIFTSQQTNSEPSLLYLLHCGDGVLKSGCCRGFWETFVTFRCWSLIKYWSTLDWRCCFFPALIVAGSCWPAEWSADEFVRDRLWRGGLLTAKKGLAKPVWFQNFAYGVFKISGSPSHLFVDARVSFVLLESRLVFRKEVPSL